MSDSEDYEKEYEKYYNANEDFDKYVHPPGSGNYGGDVKSSDTKEQYYGYKTLNAEADKLGKKGDNRFGQSWSMKK